MLPEKDELPAPDDEYFEKETMKAWGMTPPQWRQLSVMERADLMAHEMVKGMRDAWVSEKMRLKAGGKTDKPESQSNNMFDAMRRRYGL